MYQRKTNNPQLFLEIFSIGGGSGWRRRSPLLPHKCGGPSLVGTPRLGRSAQFCLASSPLLNTGICVVIMDAFVVLGFHFIPCNIGMLI